MGKKRLINHQLLTSPVLQLTPNHIKLVVSYPTSSHLFQVYPHYVPICWLAISHCMPIPLRPHIIIIITINVSKKNTITIVTATFMMMMIIIIITTPTMHPIYGHPQLIHQPSPGRRAWLWSQWQAHQDPCSQQ